MSRKASKRRCARCQSPLPAGARSTRVFCSTRCRVRHWDEHNRPQADDPYWEQLHARTNPKHYHLQRGVISFLVGHRDNDPWFGTSCPPQCPGLREGETFEPMEEFWRPYAKAGAER